MKMGEQDRHKIGTTSMVHEQSMIVVQRLRNCSGHSAYSSENVLSSAVGFSIPIRKGAAKFHKRKKKDSF